MSSFTHTCEGVILSTLNFKDYDQILTVFSKEEGLMKFIVKGALRTKSGKGAKTAPLTHAEFIYEKKQSEIYLCKELSVLNHHLHLRKNLAILEASCDVGNALLASQMLHKASPQLYELMLFYIQSMGQVPDPWILAASFRLKILRHDGLFGLNASCNICNIDLANAYISEGESFCEDHAPHMHFVLNPEESTIVFELACSRNLERIAALRMGPILQAKIATLFSECIETR